MGRPKKPAPEATDLDESSEENLPQPVSVVPGEGALQRYGSLLEVSAVATMFSVMSSSKVSAGERLEAAKLALGAIGKLTPASQGGAVLSIQLMEPVKNAFRGFSDFVDVMDRTPRAEVVKDGV